MYVACAAVRLDESGLAQFALAGHLPILHYRRSAGSVERLTMGGPPLAMFEATEFPTGTVRLDVGDPSPAEASTPTTRPSGTPAASRADPVHPRRDLEEREIPQELPPTPLHEGSRRSTHESRQIAGGTPSEASSFPGYQDAIFSTEL